MGAESEFTVPQILGAISSALKEHDMPVVVSLMHVLAVRDPEAAQSVLDLTNALKEIDQEATR